LLAGAAIAVSLSAPPGPVSPETTRRGLKGGFRPALMFQVGPIVGHVAWCPEALLERAQLVSVN
jgi:chemosensory pili system protein ChpE